MLGLTDLLHGFITKSEADAKAAKALQNTIVVTNDTDQAVA